MRVALLFFFEAPKTSGGIDLSERRSSAIFLLEKFSSTMFTLSRANKPTDKSSVAYPYYSVSLDVAVEKI